MIVVTLRLPLIYLHLYQTQSPKTRLILTSKMMTIHSIFQPPEITTKVPLEYVIKIIHPLLHQTNHSTPTTSLILSSYGKWNLCFQIYGKTAHSVQCAKSRALTKATYSIIDIE